MRVGGLSRVDREALPPPPPGVLLPTQIQYFIVSHQLVFVHVSNVRQCVNAHTIRMEPFFRT